MAIERVCTGGSVYAIAIISTRENIQHYLLPEEICSVDHPSEQALNPLTLLHVKMHKHIAKQTKHSVAVIVSFLPKSIQ